MRVVAGSLGGRRLSSPPGRDTRPTSELVRGAIFNSLGARVQGAVVADLFAGSGAMGIEALSRGAARAIFVESDRRAAAVIRANLAALGITSIATVVVMDVMTWAREHSPVDLIIADPPYDFDKWDELVSDLAAFLVVESDRPVSPEGWEVVAVKRHGGTVVSQLHPRGASTLRTALIPGSFDPFHNGHLEVVETASRLFDGVIVAAIRNPQKTKQLFDLDERMEMIGESVAHLANVKIDYFASLTVDVARSLGADVLVKGLRQPTDFEYELAQAQMNKAISGVETIFFPASPHTLFIASSLVRDIARFGGADRVHTFVPDPVYRRLLAKFPPHG